MFSFLLFFFLHCTGAGADFKSLKTRPGGIMISEENSGSIRLWFSGG